MGKEAILISVGGSLIVPEKIDVAWISKFKNLLGKHTKKYKFAIICGGGRTAREYQNAAKLISNPGKTGLDWIGIHATVLNASLIKNILGIHENIITNPTKKVSFKEDFLVASGWKPGCSTDCDAVLLAKNFGVKKIVNLTNIDYVYDKDPRKFREARPIKEISWHKFRKILPKKWSPGLNAPFDPIAAKQAEKLKMEVTIMSGKKLKNFENYLNNKKFKGTIVR